MYFLLASPICSLVTLQESSSATSTESPCVVLWCAVSTTSWYGERRIVAGGSVLAELDMYRLTPCAPTLPRVSHLFESNTHGSATFCAHLHNQRGGAVDGVDHVRNEARAHRGVECDYRLRPRANETKPVLNEISVAPDGASDIL